jgi:hypothetical protein
MKGFSLGWLWTTRTSAREGLAGPATIFPLDHISMLPTRRVGQGASIDRARESPQNTKFDFLSSVNPYNIPALALTLTPNRLPPLQ